MEQPRIIYKSALAVFKDKQILLVRPYDNATAFLTLGGKIEEGESVTEALIREVKEEVNATVDESTLEYLREFEAPAFGKENTLVNVKLYSGELLDEPTPSSEIEEIRYFDSTIPAENLTPLTELLFEWLKQQELIK